MADIYEVVDAVRNMGAIAVQQSIVSSFLTINEDEFTSSNFEEFIATCNEIQENFTDPWAMEHFSKPAGSLSEEERYRMWAWESNGGLPMDARQAILDMHIKVCGAFIVKIFQYFNSEQYPVFEHSMQY